ncbi:MAG TPA: FAD-binding oxidoreductase [Syntrophomonadaceae bacterium]|nr:FAD-binding oxidoreductase [Syntrophomonadaceae bacterium]
MLRLKDSDFHGLTGEVVTPDDPVYEGARQEWNRAIQKYPRVIVYCYDNDDVSNAICWARENRVSIRIRSGGHNYEGYSVGNNILVIDISRMNGLKLDRSRNLLHVQGGVRNRQLYEFVSSKGYPFPGGTCPSVGVSGYTLGGGWGYTCRYFGLGCDNLVELEMVDYTGRVLTANKYHNADLFWACRGAGGGNFGVVVSMNFSLPPKVERVTFIEISYPHASSSSQVEFLNVWQNWLPDADERIGINARLFNSKEDGIGIFARGIFFGSPENAREILQPFTDISGAELTLQYISFLDAIEQIEATYPPSEKFKSTGRFTHRQYSIEEIEKLVGLIQERPKGSVYVSLIVYALGGAVQDVSKHATAFYYRNAQYILAIESLWINPQFAEANIKWVQQKFRYIRSITRGSYVNFPYNSLMNYEQAYFGQNKYRLEKIKRKYDPFNIFSFPQGIKSPG